MYYPAEKNSLKTWSIYYRGAMEIKHSSTSPDSKAYHELLEYCIIKCEIFKPEAQNKLPKQPEYVAKYHG